MAQGPDIRVRLAPSGVEEVVAAFRKVEGEAARSGRVSAAAVSGVSGAVKELARLLPAISLAALAREVVTRTIDAERSLNRLNTTLKTTGFAAGITSKEIEGLVEELKQSTPFDDDEIRKGIASLLRFRDVQGEVFREAARLAPDLAVAIDTDVVSAFQRMGRALQDPETGLRGLRDAGVKLSEQQIELAKRLKNTGDLAGAQRLVIDALRKSVGGAAAGENIGLFGATKSLSKAWDDLLKALGKRLTAGDEESVIGKITRDIRLLAKTISESKILESLVAFATFGKAVPKSEPNFGAVKGQIRGAPTVENEETQARAGELQRILERQQELAAARGKSQEELRIALGKQAAESAVGQEKDLAEQRTRILEAYYRNGLLSLDDYYTARKNLIDIALATEIKTLGDKMTAESEVFHRAFAEGDTQKQIASLVALQKLLDEAGGDLNMSRVRMKAANDLLAIDLERGKANEALGREQLQMDAKLLEAQGRRKEAALLALKEEIAETEKLLRLRGASEAEITGKTTELRDVKTRGINFDDARGRGDELLRDLARRREEISERVARGQLLQIQGEAQIIAIERDRLPLLQAIADEMLRMAGTDPFRISEARDFATSLGAIRVSVDEAGRAMAQFQQQAFDALVNNTTTFFTTGIDEAENFGAAIKGLARGIFADLRQMAARELSNSIWRGIFSLFGGAASAGIGAGVAGTAAGSAVVATSSGGFVPALAEGGMIRGPGTGTSDSIPAWLSDGEFVVRAAAVKQPGTLEVLRAINRGMHLPALAPIQRRVPSFAEGGLVGEGGGRGSDSTFKGTLGLEEGLVMRHLESTGGQRTLIKVLGKNKRALRTALGV
jgi:hypothetical protein